MDLTKSQSDATGMSDQEIATWWSQMPNSPFRKVLEYELEKRRAVERSALEDAATFEEFSKQKGVVKGLMIAIGILNRKDNPTHKKS